MNPPSRPTASGPGGPDGAPTGRPTPAGEARGAGAQRRLARLSQERMLALGVVAALVVLSGVGAAVLAKRGNDGVEKLARAQRTPTTTAADDDPKAGSTTTTKPSGTSATTVRRTPAVTRRAQTVATRRPGSLPTAARRTTGRTTTRPRTSGGAPAAPGGGGGGGGVPVDPGNPGDPGGPVDPGGPGDPGGPVDPGGPGDPGVPVEPPWGPAAPCAGTDLLPVVDLSSLRATYAAGQPVDLNVGIRNVTTHECEPPPAPNLVVTTEAGVTVARTPVDLSVDADAWAPNETLRQLVSWTPTAAGVYVFRVDVDGVSSDSLALQVG